MSFPQILLSGAIQSAAILLLAGFMVRRLPRPDHKHQLRVAAFLMLLVLPICWLLVPGLGWSALAELLPAEELAGPAAASGGASMGELPSFSFLTSADVQAPGAGGVSLVLLLACVWAGVSLALLVRTLAGHLSARRLAARSSGSPWAVDGVRVRLSDEVTAPAVAGMWRPVILLPASAPGWTAAQLEAALAHEAAHIRRRDLAGALAADVACSLYWFNPLAWRARSAMSLEREMACDARVLAGGMARFDYADALLAVARSVRGLEPRGTLAMAAVSEVESRVRYILEAAPEAEERSRRKMLPMALLLLSLPLLAAVRPAAVAVEPGPEGPSAPSETMLLNPRSELIPLDYAMMARDAAAIPATGPEAEAVTRLKAELDRQPEGFDDLVRERAIWTLSRMRRGSLLEPLIQDLASTDWRVRAYATWGLAVVRSPRATAHLAELLDDPVWRVRAGAAAAIEEIGDRSARPVMAAALGDPAWQVRYSAIQYFADDPDPTQRARLRALRSDPHAGTRLLVEEALGDGR